MSLKGYILRKLNFYKNFFASKNQKHSDRVFFNRANRSFSIAKSPRTITISLLVIFLTTFSFTLIFSHFNNPTKNSDAIINPENYLVFISSANALNINVNSTFEGAIGSAKDTLNIKTNAPGGYKLYLSTDKLSNTNQPSSLAKDNNFTNTSKFIKSSVGSFSAPTILKRNTWGFAIPSSIPNLPSNGFDSSYDNISSSSKFAKVPAKNEELLIHSTNSANEQGVILPIYYALRVDINLPSGVYSNTVIYTAIIDATNQNQGEATVSPNQGPASGGTNVEISTSLKITPAPANLNDFLGVGSDNTPTVNIGDKACSNPTFSIQDQNLKITCQTQPNNGTKDVVIAVPKLGKTYTIVSGFKYQSDRTFNGITKMQEMTQEICDNETTPYAFENGASSGNVVANTTRNHSADKNLVPEAELTDIRDNKKYVIRKLADGNCWMVQNLDLGDTEVQLTPENTDLNGVAGFTLPAAQTSPSLWGDHNNASDVNRIKLYNDGNKWLTNVVSNQQETVVSNMPSDPELKIRHIGNYYNWYTATAKTGVYEMSYGQEASSSICPKGWKLPHGESGFDNLSRLYGIPSLIAGSQGISASFKARKPPLSLTLSGEFYPSQSFGHPNGRVMEQGQIGHFWSSSLHSGNPKTHASSAYISSSFPSFKNGKEKTVGISIRCVNRNNRKISDITKMQEMTPEICQNTTTPHAFVNGATSGTIVSDTTRALSSDKNLVPEAELTDTRDNKKYVIRKLADGNCWMVQNLDLGSTGQSLTLTALDSDILGDFVLNNISNPGAIWPTGINAANVNIVRAIDNGDKWLTNVSSGSNEAISSSQPSNPEERLRHIGNYYNWYTATAGSGSYYMQDNDATYSICPKGWRLPFAKDSFYDKTFQKLTDTYKITNGNSVNNDSAASLKLRAKPLSFTMSGHYWANNSLNQGNYGYFWSNTSFSNYSISGSMNLASRYVDPKNSSNKMDGFTIRCVSR